MLENKEAVFKEGKVIAFRIITGDEIIGKVTAFDSQSVTVKKPCTLTFDPQTGNVGLMPASLLSDPDKDIVYQRNAIVAIMTPREDAANSYEQYASPVAIAKKGGLVLPAGAK
jgi:hypothetical protein